jgi:hypothetical protein
MKKRIIITFISLVCLIIPSVLVIANNTAHGDKVNIIRTFKMDVYNDGKLTDEKKSVYLSIFNALDGSDKICVFWKGVNILPNHSLKKIILCSEQYSTYDGSIKNVIVTKNSFSFVIDTLPYLGETIQVVGQKGDEAGKFDVKATALWSELVPDYNVGKVLHKILKIEWQLTDKIILPYTEVD